MTTNFYISESYQQRFLPIDTRFFTASGKNIQRIVEIEKSIPCTLPTANMIFRKESGEYVSTDSFKYPSRIIHYRLGLEKFDYHSLRHTHATMLIEAGV